MPHHHEHTELPAEISPAPTLRQKLRDWFTKPDETAPSTPATAPVASPEVHVHMSRHTRHSAAKAVVQEKNEPEKTIVPEKTVDGPVAKPVATSSSPVVAMPVAVPVPETKPVDSSSTPVPAQELPKDASTPKVEKIKTALHKIKASAHKQKHEVPSAEAVAEMKVPEPQKESQAVVPPELAATQKSTFFSRKKEAPASPDDVSAHLAKIRAEQQKKKPRKKLRRQSLQEYLGKAGYDINAEKLKKRIFHGAVAVFFIVSIIVLIEASTYGARAGNVLLFMLGMWTAVFAGFLLIAYACVYFFLDYRIYNRTRELEDVLPDFLQLASSNIAAGMPIDRALWYAIRPNFGVLAKEMEEVAKATMAGEDLETSLIRFTDKYESVTLKRSINILIEGLHAGGEMADLLNKIALNIDEMKIMKKDMAASVTTYAIFITFASIIIAPFLFALATELLTIIVKITSTLDLSNSGSFLTLGKPDPNSVHNFQTFSILMLLVSTIFSACIVSVIRRGNVIEGVKTIPVYAAVAVVVYYLAAMLLHGIFSGII